MGLLRRLDAAARAGFPGMFTALLIILAAVPVGIPGIIGAVSLPCIFFWTIFRPAAMPAPVVFALGLLQDLLSFAALGTGVLTLLILHGVTLRLRDVLARQSFLAVWIGFCVAAFGVAGAYWGLQSVLALQLPPIAPALHAALLACGLYPAIALVLTRVHEAMRHAEVAP